MINEVKILFAGQGILPLQIMQNCQPCHAILFHSIQYAKDWDDIPHTKFHLGQLGAMCALINKISATIGIMAGDVKRPALKDIMNIDEMGQDYLKKNALALLKGDDGLLKSLSQYISQQTTIRWVAPNDILKKQRKKGLWVGPKPTTDAMGDGQIGLDLLQAISPFDIGQAVLVQNGQIIGVEGKEGTSAMLQRLPAYIQPHYPPILVKNIKQGQSLALDLPTIGMETIRLAQELGCKTLFFSHLGNIINEEEVYNYCDNNQFTIFLV